MTNFNSKMYKSATDSDVEDNETIDVFQSLEGFV
jgi:hypothetical protein